MTDRDDYLLEYESDDDEVRFEGEKVLYKFVEGPPWTHFVHFDNIGMVNRAYLWALADGAHSARVTHRRITTESTELAELDMVAIGAEIREQRLKRRALGDRP